MARRHHFLLWCCVWCMELTLLSNAKNGLGQGVSLRYRSSRQVLSSLYGIIPYCMHLLYSLYYLKLNWYNSYNILSFAKMNCSNCRIHRQTTNRCSQERTSAFYPTDASLDRSIIKNTRRSRSQPWNWKYPRPTREHTIEGNRLGKILAGANNARRLI